jgi:ribosome biogenesis SPOUT family RNA methylase Rps3
MPEIPTSQILFVIEHLEPELSEWLWIEYAHAVELVGREGLMITNVKREDERRKLLKLCDARPERVADLFPQRELLVLDPQARRKLTPADLNKRRVVVIGGILGDDPPRGRTRALLTERLPGAASRSLGKHQFSIDGSVYVAKRVSEGAELDEIPTRVGIEIPVGRHCSVILPFAYPLVDGRPLISDKLVAYLKRRGASFEPVARRDRHRSLPDV